LKLPHGVDVVRKRVSRLLHLDTLKRSSGSGAQSQSEAKCEWVIAYRTVHGFCCVYRGVPIDFSNMLDLQIWVEEHHVQTYFIGS
jgi:hypothetical protein